MAAVAPRPSYASSADSGSAGSPLPARHRAERRSSPVISKCLFLAIMVTGSLHPESVQACAACYGQSDSPMAAGMNWGILSLLVIIVSVLVSIAASFIVLARKSSARALSDPALSRSADILVRSANHQASEGDKSDPPQKQSEQSRVCATPSASQAVEEPFESCSPR